MSVGDIWIVGDVRSPINDRLYLVTLVCVWPGYTTIKVFSDQ